MTNIFSWPGELAITAEELAELRRIAAERPLPRKETKRSGDLFPKKHGEKFGASKFLKLPKLGLTLENWGYDDISWPGIAWGSTYCIM